MKKIDLTDVTFCIPVHLDSIHRKQNLELILKFLRYYFDTNIAVGEITYDSKPKLAHLQKDYMYVHYDNPEKFFHKTKLLNMLYLKTETPYVFSYDCDVLFPPQQIVKCVTLLRKRIYDACLPFRDYTIHVPRQFYKVIYETLDLSRIKKPDDLADNEWKNASQVDGLALGLTQKMIFRMGFENENFKSWGPEDSERLYRIQFMGGKIGKVVGVGYHINHFRGIQSTNRNAFFKQNEEEFKKIKSFKTPVSLTKYLESFSWYRELAKAKHNTNQPRLEILHKESEKRDVSEVKQQQRNERFDFYDKVTFIIPFHYDTDDRLENVNLSLDYLYKNVNAQIVVGEMGADQYFESDMHKNKSGFSYNFYKEDVFSKTKLINNLIKEVYTEFFCLHDVDIFLTHSQFKETLNYLDNTLIDAIIPYNGLYLEIPRHYKDVISNIDDIKKLDEFCSYRFLKEHYLGTGACIFFRRDSFIESGMMNQFFKKWGQEDDEVVYRMFTLGNNIIRMKTNDPIHHLMHKIDKKGFGYQEHNLSNIQQEELRRIKTFTYGEMRIYANKLIKENI